MYAIDSGHTQVAQTLLQVSSSAIPPNGNTPLHVAVERGNLPILDALLLRNQPLERLDGAGKTALMSAAEKGHTLIVIRLLNKGANVNTRDTRGKTALYRAAIRRHSAIIQVLRSRGGTL